MKWDNKCLNVWMSGAVVDSKIYNCRITDTGGGIVLVIQCDGKLIHRETYIDTVDNIKQLAKDIIYKVK